MKRNFRKLGKHFEENGFVILKNVITEEEWLEIMEVFGEVDFSLNGGDHLSHILGTVSNRKRILGGELFRRVCLLRTKVLCYADHSLFHDWMKKFHDRFPKHERDQWDLPHTYLDFVSDAEWMHISLETMKKYKGWSQFKHYTVNDLGNQHHFREHQDGPEDTFALLLLSDPIKDYSGGLIVHGQRLPWNTPEFCADSRMSHGDLLVFDGHRHRHEVRVTTDIELRSEVVVSDKARRHMFSLAPGQYNRQGRKLYFINLKPYQDWYNHPH